MVQTLWAKGREVQLLKWSENNNYCNAVFKQVAMQFNIEKRKIPHETCTVENGRPAPTNT